MKKKTKILITGAAGFIGSHLVDLLLEENEPIERLRLFIKKGTPLRNLPPKKFDIIWGDIRDEKIVREALNEVETIYHLAAKIDFNGKTYQEYKEVNVMGSQNILDACRGKNIQKFVFFSSIAVFGLPAEIGNIINWDEKHPKTYTNFYGQSKFEAEQRVISAYKKWGIPYAIIRPASVYGPREVGPTYALYKAIKKHQFIMIGSGNNKMHYVYVKDLVKGARQAQLSKRKTGDYILAGKESTRFKEIVKWVATSIGEKVPSVYLPKDIALFLSYGLKFFSDLLGQKSPLFPSRVKTMTTTYYYNITKAVKEIDYRPQVSFKEGTAITGKWYLDNNYL